MEIRPYFECEHGVLYKGNCLEVMPFISKQGVKVDAVITDPPYGTTQCKWDSVIPLEKMWACLKALVKNNSAICLFGNEPFSSLLRCSNLKEYKYDWIWEKDKSTGHLNAKKQPMRKTERIIVFYGIQCIYNPQISDKPKENIRPETKFRKNTDAYGNMEKESKRGIPINKSYPNDILKFRGCFGDKGKSNHSTEKPVSLIEYLIKTYTNEGDTVLDFTIGSGTTAVACINTNRKFIGIEMEEKYCEIAKKRIIDSLISDAF